MSRRFCALAVLCGMAIGCSGAQEKPRPELSRREAEVELLVPKGYARQADLAVQGLLEAQPGESPADAPGFNTEAYDHLVDNAFLAVAHSPLSTFSIDVDTASYSNVRRFLSQGMLPPKGAVRIEELINYFPYSYPQPQGDAPFSVNIEIAACPWNVRHRLARIGLKGREIPAAERPVSNLVFLIDVSGSMQDANKLPLVKTGLKLLVDQLGENDRVAVVVYAGASGLVLPSTGGDQKQIILSAIDNLHAGGSTNGAAGIELAYQIAAENFVRGGTNRVILCTDGDFNVGVTSQDQLVTLVQEKAKGGVFVTVLGFGMGNYKDSMLEKLADKGNGNYGYIDTAAEARKLLVEQVSGTLVTIAKDVKLQIEFNPRKIGAYRLIGYENRMLAAQDFNDDRKDAGEIGAGHTVTALYELIPAGQESVEGAEALPGVDPLKYQRPGSVTVAADSDEVLTLKLRYKAPAADQSQLLDIPAIDRGLTIAQASTDFSFAAAVASFGMVLRNSPHKGDSTLPAALELAEAALGEDRGGYRGEFVALVRKVLPLVSSR